MAGRRLRAAFAIIPLVLACSVGDGCVRFVAGPSAPSSVREIRTPMHVIYRHHGLYEGEDAVPAMLERALRGWFRGGVTVESVLVPLEPATGPGTSPNATLSAEPGVITVHVQQDWEVVGPRTLERTFRFLLTCGFWPMLDRDDVVWRVMVFSPGRQSEAFETRASRYELDWTPLAPLWPLNLAWDRRAMDVLAAAFPAQLSAHLAPQEHPDSE